MIVAHDLTVRFGERSAAAGASLALQAGHITILLGRSGAGKSTLLRCLNGLQQPTSGTLEFDGRLLRSAHDWRAHRRRIGMVFQTHQVILRQSALTNVLKGRLGYHSVWRSFLPAPRRELNLALEALDRVGLADRAHQRCDQLSGGERQRVGIARALVQEPEIILADEPVASLDPSTAHQIMDIIRTVCREDRITALVSLHQVDLAHAYGERVVGMSAGRIVFDRAIRDLDKEAIDMIYHAHTPPAPGDGQALHDQTDSFSITQAM